MQLTLQQFFNKFPILKQCEFADLVAMQYISLNRAVNGNTLTREQLAFMQAALKRLAREIGEVELIHDNFQKERKPYIKKVEAKR